MGRGAVVEGWGSELRRLRRARGWTQEDLEEHSGLDQSSISQFEREDKRPSMASVRRLAAAFAMAAEELARMIGHLDPEPDNPEPADSTPVDELVAEFERQLFQIPGLRAQLERRKAEDPEDYAPLIRSTARHLGILAGSLLRDPGNGDRA